MLRIDLITHSDSCISSDSIYPIQMTDERWMFFFPLWTENELDVIVRLERLHANNALIEWKIKNSDYIIEDNVYNEA